RSATRSSSSRTTSSSTTATTRTSDATGSPAPPIPNEKPVDSSPDSKPSATTSSSPPPTNTPTLTRAQSWTTPAKRARPLTRYLHPSRSECLFPAGAVGVEPGDESCELRSEGLGATAAAGAPSLHGDAFLQQMQRIHTERAVLLDQLGQRHALPQ